MQQLRKIIAFYGRFLLSFSRIGYRLRSLRWRALDGGFAGRTWLVTGASGGIGRAASLEAAGRGARVLAVARNASRLEQLRREADGQVLALVCDLALKAEVRQLVSALAAKGERIDVLLNNVGVLLDDHSLTREGHETSFATNLLNHHLLTQSLLAAGLLARDAVVINMSSGGMYNVPLMVAPLQMPAPGYNGVAAYGLHKRAQLALNAWYRRQHGGGGRAFYAMHPGWVDTEGVRISLPRFRRLLRPILRDARQGADTALWLAATRPVQQDDESIWFDRAERPAHVFARTRRGRDTAAGLVEFLEDQLRHA